MESTLDIAIIGAGITGLGVAEALKSSSLRIGVFDSGAVCEQTSSNHLRIIHGGFRYLQSMDLARMWQSCGDQQRLVERYPDLLDELPCLLPLKPGSLRSAVPLTVANWFYSVVCALRSRRWSLKGRCLTPGEAQAIMPTMGAQLQAGAFTWSDYLINDIGALNRRIRGDLESSGIQFFEGHELRRGQNTGDQWDLEFSGARSRLISARYVVNCSGPWVVQVADRLGTAECLNHLGWLKAFNLVVNRLLTKRWGVAFLGNSGSMFFMTPRGSQQTAIGTFYLSTSDILAANLSEAETEQAVNQLNSAWPNLNLTKDQIVAADVGYIPAIKSTGHSSAACTRPQIIRSAGMLHVVNIKYTTFLSLGEKVARQVLNELQQ